MWRLLLDNVKRNFSFDFLVNKEYLYLDKNTTPFMVSSVTYYSESPNAITIY
jgi:hypothetical protein